MDNYHINPETGNPGLCSAKVKCPFGGADAHYFSKEDAQKAFENATKDEALKAWKKKKVVAEPEVKESTPAASDTSIGHGRSTYFHGHVSTPSAPKEKPKPKTGLFGHGGFHGYATDPPSNRSGFGGHGY